MLNNIIKEYDKDLKVILKYRKDGNEMLRNIGLIIESN